MASYNKFNITVEHFLSKVHDLMGDAGASPPAADDLKVYLSNETPLATDTVKTDIADITQENGYTGPVSVLNDGTRSTGTVTVTGVSLQISASGGTVGPFQYVPLYNDTPSSPTDPLIAWWDRGAALTLQDGESFSIKFNNAAVGNPGNIFTLA